MNDKKQIVVYEPRGLFHALILDFSEGENNIKELNDKGYCAYNVDTLEQCADLIHDYFESKNKIIQLSPTTIGKVNDDVSKIFRTSPKALSLKGRTRNIVTARHTAMYIIKKKFYMGSNPVSLKSVGEIYNRDHATVLNALKVVGELLQFNVEYKNMAIPLLRKYGILTKVG